MDQPFQAVLLVWVAGVSPRYERRSETRLSSALCKPLKNLDAIGSRYRPLTGRWGRWIPWPVAKSLAKVPSVGSRRATYALCARQAPFAKARRGSPDRRRSPKAAAVPQPPLFVKVTLPPRGRGRPAPFRYC